MNAATARWMIIAAAAVFLLPAVILVVIIASDENDGLGLCGSIGGSAGAAGAELLAALEPGQVQLILATVRSLESGGGNPAGDYDIINYGDGVGDIASGAYQFTTSTWGNFGGFRNAGEAPAEVQDGFAVEYLGRVLAMAADNGRDWTYVPIGWYYPAALNDADLNYIPAAHEGNSLTLAEYRERWLRKYDEIAGGDAVGGGGSVSCGVAGQPIDAPNGVAMPLPNILPPQFTQPHGYPAVDIMVPIGTPVYLVHGGTVRNISHYNGNCAQNGLDHRECRAARASCGNGVTVVDEVWPDVTWTYCHLSAVYVRETQVLTAGTNLGLSGHTGQSGGPHLHIEIRINGTEASRRCVPALLMAVYERQQIIDPHELPTTDGCVKL